MLKAYRCITLACMCLLTGCTYSVTIVGGQGKSDDLVDETTTASPDIPITAKITPVRTLQ